MLGNIFIARSKEEINYIYTAKEQAKIPKKTKIVVVDDMVSTNGKDVICGSILLPPTNSLIEMVEGDLRNFSIKYLEYLQNDPYVLEYICVLFAGLLYYNNDYILYVGPDVDESIFNTLCNFLGIRFHRVFPNWFGRYDFLILEMYSGQIPAIMQVLASYGFVPQSQPQSPFVQF